VSRSGQSSIPGLYFAGAPTAVSLGPSERFIGGTHNSVRHLARSVAGRRDGSRARPAEFPGGSQPRSSEAVSHEHA
jgi:hypothetical protein